MLFFFIGVWWYIPSMSHALIFWECQKLKIFIKSKIIIRLG